MKKRVRLKINICGKKCPYTLIDVGNALDKVKEGEVIEVLSDYEPAVKNTIPSMCDKRKLKYEVEEVSENLWKIYIEKN